MLVKHFFNTASFERKVKLNDKRMNMNGNFMARQNLANLNEVKMNLIVKFANLAGKSYIKLS